MQRLPPDGAAVRRFLESADAEEVDALLDGISRRDGGNKSEREREPDDWLPLVHALVQCDATRFRAAARIVHVLWSGAGSELQAMQLLTEVNLGFALAIQELGELRSAGRQLRRARVVEEINLLLQATYRLVRDTVSEQGEHVKSLPQVLGIVPSLFGMLADLSDDQEGAHVNTSSVHDKLVDLLELPWSSRTLPFLLDALKDCSTFISRNGWELLQHNVARMVLSSGSLSGEVINLIIRECVSVADVTNSTQWIDITRFLVRKLPVASRQEAEFNLQMGLHQSQRLVELVVQAIQDSVAGASSTCTTSEVSPEEDAHRVICAAGWHDLVFLLHTLQASKPILHHRSASTRVARESSDFKKIERLVWLILAGEAKSPTPSDERPLFPIAKASMTSYNVGAHMSECVSRVINFGGKQAYSREWKALLLMDIALYWLDQSCYNINNATTEGSSNSDAADSMTKCLLSQYVLLAIFQKSPEAQNELLRSLLDRGYQPVFAQTSITVLRQLFESHPPSFHPHLNTIQDWLSMNFHSCLHSAEQIFMLGSRLSMHHRSLFNFLMIFLRKLLSTGNQQYQRFAINLWCSWLEDTFLFDEQQQEEIVAAVKTAVQVCVMIRPWSMGRIENLFSCGRCTRLRDTGRQDLHQFLSQEVARFIRPMHHQHVFCSGVGSETEDNDDEVRVPSDLHFEFCPLDDFYHHDSSPQGTARVGLLFQKSVASLLAFERASSALQNECNSTSTLKAEGGTELQRWIAAFVSDQDVFFRWICQGSIIQPNLSEKRSGWELLVRMFMGSALCTLTIESLLQEEKDTDLTTSSTISLWSVIELEFCIHRMVQNVIRDGEKKKGWSVPRGFSSKFKLGLVDVLKPHTSKLLGLVHTAFCGAQVRDSTGQPRISFDTLVFVLDMISDSHDNTETLAARSRKKKPIMLESRDISVDTVLLLLLYREVADQVLSQAALARSSTEADSPKVVFAVYSDTFSLKVPSSHRYMINLGSQADGSTVLLDVKAGDQVLGRVCAALARSISACTRDESTTVKMQSQLGTLLKAKPWSDIAGVCEHGNSFMGLAQVLLSDISIIMQSNDMTKWKMGAGLLAKRLCEVPGVLADVSQRRLVEQLATQIMCEHVVHHLPLLRLLLGISLVSLYFQFSTGDIAGMTERLHSILRGCGFSINADGSCLSQGTPSGSKRRRLRQAQYPTGSAEDSESEAALALRDTSVPHFVSASAQSVALESLIIEVDRLVSTVTSYLQVKDTPAPHQRLQRVQGLVAVLDVLRVSVYSGRDFSWVSTKVLSRALSIIESTLRIGTKCELLGEHKNHSTLSNCTVEIFDCAVLFTAQSRMWVFWLINAISDASSKTRLSAIALKLDIFLLKVPTKAQNLLKKKLPPESVAKLRRVIQMAKSNISSGGLNADKPTKLSRTQYVDVVPIVRKKKKRLRSRHPIIDAYLHEEDGDDAFADLEDFIE